MRCATCGNGNPSPALHHLPRVRERPSRRRRPRRPRGPRPAGATRRPGSGISSRGSARRRSSSRRARSGRSAARRSARCGIQSPRVSRQHARDLLAGGGRRPLDPRPGLAERDPGRRPPGEGARLQGRRRAHEIGPFVCSYRRVDGIGCTTELQELLDSQADTQEVVDRPPCRAGSRR
jgi:hypothetical protein